MEVGLDCDEGHRQEKTRSHMRIDRGELTLFTMLWTSPVIAVRGFGCWKYLT